MKRVFLKSLKLEEKNQKKSQIILEVKKKAITFAPAFETRANTNRKFFTELKNILSRLGLDEASDWGEREEMKTVRSSLKLWAV